MMKRVFYVWPMVALLLASCSSDITLTTASERSAINLRPIVPGSTRATEVGLTTLGDFMVIGDGPVQGSATGFQRTASKSGSSWSLYPPVYWALGDDNNSAVVKFTAYYPADLDEPEDGKLSVNLQNTSIDEQQDVLVAYNTGTKGDNAASGVALNFRHVLSQIIVQATNKNTETRQVEIIGVKIANVPSDGTLKLPTTSTAAETFTWGDDAWTVDADLRESFMAKRADGTAAVVLTGSPQSLMFGHGSFMLIPQQLPTTNDLTSDDVTSAYISVLCRITNLTDDRVIYPATTDGNSTQYGFAAIPIDTRWLPGYKYTYTLNFYQGDGGAGQVDPDPTNPDDDNDEEVDDKPGNPDKESDDDKGGSDIDPEAERPITFTVTMESWTDADSVIDKDM